MPVFSHRNTIPKLWGRVKGKPLKILAQADSASIYQGAAGKIGGPLSYGAGCVYFAVSLPVTVRSTKSTATVSSAPTTRQITAFWINPARMKHTKLTAATVMA